MKSLQKVTRIKLKVKHNFDFVLIGIVSAEPDYKLSLTLNTKLRISLKQKSPIRLPDKNGDELHFSRFSDTDGSHETLFNLISNRQGKHYFLKDLKNIDYLFQSHNPDNETSINSTTTILRKIETITAVFIIKVNTIKDKNLLHLIQ